MIYERRSSFEDVSYTNFFSLALNVRTPFRVPFQIDEKVNKFNEMVLILGHKITTAVVLHANQGN